MSKNRIPKILHPFYALAISKILCDDCRKTFNELLEGTVDEFIFCEKCKKEYEEIKKQLEVAK